MTAPEVKGWCPGAHRPMMSGDGLVVRVRPRLARLTAPQAIGLCEAAMRYGSGTIDLTNRANLQLRGVAVKDHEALLGALAELGLLDAEPGLESRRNILVTPLYQKDDLSNRLTRALLERLREFPDLPAKFGFAVDTGTSRLLSRDSADIRFETACNGDLLIRADGSATGRVLSEAQAIDAAIELARWFAINHSQTNRRMARLLAVQTLPEIWTGTTPSGAGTQLLPGETPIGSCLGAAFGQLPAGPLAELIRNSNATAMRVTPWRLFLLEGAVDVQTSDFVTEPGDPLLTTDACAGAPLCPQAQAETREIARMIAPRVPGTLHVSGCSKGCARNRTASVTLVGRNGRFDLVKDGCAGDEPAMHDLTPETLQTLTDLT